MYIQQQVYVKQILLPALGLSLIGNISSVESTSISSTLNPVTAVSLADKADAQISGDQDIRCLSRNPKSLSCAHKDL
jgi:hypothetical protein